MNFFYKESKSKKQKYFWEGEEGVGARVSEFFLQGIQNLKKKISGGGGGGG